MLLPIGGGLAQNDSPTEWALSMRKWVICLWIILLGLFVAKIVVLDLFGALSMMIVVGLGYFVPFGTPPMQQRWIIFWGIMCAFNAIIDFIFGIMHMVRYLNGEYTHTGVGMGGGYHNSYDDPDRKLTPMEKYMVKVALATVIIGLLVPFVEMVCAWVCYKLFKDHPRELRDGFDSYDDPYGGGYGSAGYRGGGGGGYRGGGGGGGSANSQNRRPGEGGGGSFQPFQGSGQRLGGGR